MTISKRTVSQVHNDLSSSSSSDDELDDLMLSLSRKSSKFKSKNQNGGSLKRKCSSNSSNIVSSYKTSVPDNITSNTESKSDQSSSRLSFESRSESVTEDLPIPEDCVTEAKTKQIFQNSLSVNEEETHENESKTTKNTSTTDEIDFGKYSNISSDFASLNQYLDYSLLDIITEEKKINEREKQNDLENTKYETRMQRINFLSKKKCFRILDECKTTGEEPKHADSVQTGTETTGYAADELKFMDLRLFNVNLTNFTPQNSVPLFLSIEHLLASMKAVASAKNLKTVESISNLVLKRFNPTFDKLSVESIQDEIVSQLRNLEIRQSILEKIDEEDFKIENHLVPLLEKPANYGEKHENSNVTNNGDNFSVISDENILSKEKETANTKNYKSIKFDSSKIYLVLKKLKFFSEIILQSYSSSPSETHKTSRRLLLRFIKLHFVLLNEERVNYFGKRCINEVVSVLATLISGYLSNSQIPSDLKNKEILNLALVVLNLTRSPLILFTIHSNFAVFKPNHGFLYHEKIVEVFQCFLQILIFSEDIKLEAIIKSLIKHDFMESRYTFSEIFKDIIIEVIFKQLAFMSSHVLSIEKCSFENDVDAEQLQSLLAQTVDSNAIESPYIQRLIQLSENCCDITSIYSNPDAGLRKTKIDSLIPSIYEYYKCIKVFGTSPYWLLLKFNCMKSLIMSSLFSPQTLTKLSKESEMNNYSLKNSLHSRSSTNLISSIASMTSSISDNYIPLDEIPKDLNTTIVFLHAQKKLGFIKNLIDDFRKEFCIDLGKIDY